MLTEAVRNTQPERKRRADDKTGRGLPNTRVQEPRLVG